ncbi:MAG: polyphosphate kinase 1 [Eubacteriales bacterium]|nr:polyphosphate kinase 1 [Eubacteriales bacterium]
MFYQEVIDSFDRPQAAEPLAAGEAAYLNRELSWMEFNDRCLEEARDKDNPLYERLNFLAISCSNLDEYTTIRIASLINVIEAGGSRPDPAGLSPQTQLVRLLDKNKKFFKKQYTTYNRQILPALAEEHIFILQTQDLSEHQVRDLDKYFTKRIFPVITPMAVDASRPFPLLATRSLNLIVMLRDSGEDHLLGEEGFPPFALMQVPANLPRLIQLQPSSPDRQEFILLEDVIRLFLDRLFDNQEITAVHAFRVMRDADFDIDEDETGDLLAEIEDRLELRKRGQVIRLEIEHAAPKAVREIFQVILDLPDEQIFRIRGPIDLLFVREISKAVPRPTLQYPAFSPQPSPAFLADPDPFACIRAGDIFLHHPFESFQHTIDVIEQAARDPQVLAIKQTLYRVSGKSPIIKSLANAALAGKQVVVLVELKARFDEANNIHWARQLERAGCHVLYGLKGLKTHSKITLIVREEEDGLRRYVHVGTGNYNDQTAKIYTDIGIWSCHESLGEDASNFFNMISGYSLPHSWKQIIPAPRWLREDTIFRIRQEAENARKGRKAMIVAKMNSLVDPVIIAELYQASQAGVIIRLIVRGISCLRPGIQGLSENIEVRSLVGRFLEHSRIFYYYNDGEEDLLIGSADWMPRNLDRRIELVAPVYDEECRRRILEILSLELRDTERARLELPSGFYKRVDRRGKELVDSQAALCSLAIKAAQAAQPDPLNQTRYEPRRGPREDQDKQNLA